MANLEKQKNIKNSNDISALLNEANNMMVELNTCDSKISSLGLAGIIQNAIKMWEDLKI